MKYALKAYETKKNDRYVESQVYLVGLHPGTVSEANKFWLTLKRYSKTFSEKENRT